MGPRDIGFSLLALGLFGFLSLKLLWHSRRKIGKKADDALVSSLAASVRGSRKIARVTRNATHRLAERVREKAKEQVDDAPESRAPD